MTARKKRIGSVKNELLKKSREAALAAVQIFNNPNITFKSESYTVLMIIAWTYLLHAYYRKKKIEYRYYEQRGRRKKFKKTKHGADKYWELGQCLKDNKSPIDKNTTNNLRFLIELRHEIEHRMTSRIDDIISARFQACCLNYNDYIKKLFGKNHGIENSLSFSLQFSSISTEQYDLLKEHPSLPKNIEGFMQEFDTSLTEEEFDNQKYAYRILFLPKTANRKGQADRVIEFIKSDSPLAETLNKEYASIKETEKKKYLPKQIVRIMRENGYPNFSMHYHIKLWQANDAKEPAKSYGVLIVGTWYWYENWLNFVEEHCNSNSAQYQ